jgi:hypothetical protein
MGRVLEGLQTMKTLSGTILSVTAATMLVISPALAVAEGPAKDVDVRIATLTDVEKACIDQLKYNWAQPGSYDETFKTIVLENVVHRKEGQANVISFEGHAYNSFMQTDRSVLVTCRPGDKKPYPVTFQIDR